MAPPAGLEPATTCINPQVAKRLVAAFSCGLNDRISLRETENRGSGSRLKPRAACEYRSSVIQSQHEEPTEKPEATAGL